jgi:hypothetical protein
MQGAGRRSHTNFNGDRIAVASHRAASLCPEIALVCCGQTLVRRAFEAEKHLLLLSLYYNGCSPWS